MQNEIWNLDSAPAEEIKVIKLFIYSPKDEPALVDYLSDISDLVFSTHASETRYGDAYYYRGLGKNVKQPSYLQ